MFDPNIISFNFSLLRDQRTVHQTKMRSGGQHGRSCTLWRHTFRRNQPSNSRKTWPGSSISLHNSIHVNHVHWTFRQSMYMYLYYYYNESAVSHGRAESSLPSSRSLAFWSQSHKKPFISSHHLYGLQCCCFLLFKTHCVVIRTFNKQSCSLLPFCIVHKI